MAQHATARAESSGSRSRLHLPARKNAGGPKKSQYVYVGPKKSQYEVVGPKKSQKIGGRMVGGPKKAKSGLFVNDLNSGDEKIRDGSGAIRLPRWGGPEYHGKRHGTARSGMVYIPSIYLHVPGGVV